VKTDESRHPATVKANFSEDTAKIRHTGWPSIVPGNGISGTKRTLKIKCLDLDILTGPMTGNFVPNLHTEMSMSPALGDQPA
jgi:hypothetical protein